LNFWCKSPTIYFYDIKNNYQSNCRIKMKFYNKSLDIFSLSSVKISRQSKIGKAFWKWQWFDTNTRKKLINDIVVILSKFFSSLLFQQIALKQKKVKKRGIKNLTKWGDWGDDCELDELRESLNLVWGRVLREARAKWNQNNTIAKFIPLLSTIRLILLTLLHNLTVGYSYIRLHLEVTVNEMKLYKVVISCSK
jgi:hypothetical protein